MTTVAVWLEDRESEYGCMAVYDESERQFFNHSSEGCWLFFPDTKRLKSFKDAI